MKRIIISGGRDFNNSKLFEDSVNGVLWMLGQDKYTIITGACPTGADHYGSTFAKYHNFDLEEYPADWKTHGAAGGPIRNKTMSDHADVLVAFYALSGSKGTKSMIDLAIKAGLEVHIFRY